MGSVQSGSRATGVLPQYGEHGSFTEHIVGQRSGSGEEMANPSGSAGDAVGFVVGGLPSLLRSAREFVHHRPAKRVWQSQLRWKRQPNSARPRPDASDANVPEYLYQFVARGSDGEDIGGVLEAMARFEVWRTTVCDWMDRKTLLAWRSTKGGLYTPTTRILGPGRMVPDLAAVVELIGEPELAWAFPARGWPFEGDAVVPLDLVKAGCIEDALRKCRARRRDSAPPSCDRRWIFPGVDRLRTAEAGTPR